MTRPRRRGALAIGFAFAALVGPALSAARQARDNAVTVPTGSASLSGIVVSADDASVPIHRAIVTIAGAGLGPDRSVVSDDTGRFAFDRLPAGSFTVTAWKAAYLASAFGAKRPAHPGTPIAVAAGQSVTDVQLRLARGGVIAGVIHGPDGTPLPGLRVVSMRQGDPPPRLNFIDPGSSDGATTDDRGAYRLFGLAPGSYVVLAVMTSTQQMELHRRTTADVDAAFREAQLKGAPAGPAPPPLQIFTAAPVYFPGTTVTSEATAVDVAVGATREDISFTVEPVRSASIEGIVQQPPGTTARVTLMISGADGSLPLSMAMAPRLARAPTPEDGHFRFVNVAPGHYAITAMITPTSSGAPAGARVAGSSPTSATSGAANSGMWWASVNVDIVGDDVTDLGLVMQPGMTFAGRVEFEATTATPPKDLTTLRVSLQPLNSVGSASSNGTSYGAPQRGSVATVTADGTFEVTGLTPGPYRISVTSPGTTGLAGFWLRSAVVDGRDVVDALTTMVAGRSVNRAVVSMTNRHTEISGALVMTTGRPATEYFVVALPTDRALWMPGARRIRSTRPATDGRFAFADLPAGTYLIAAVDDLDDRDLADSKFLENLLPAGLPVTLEEGGKARLDVRIK